MLKTKGKFIKFENRELQFYKTDLDIVDRKLYKPNKQKEKKTPKDICTIHFDTKVIEAIGLPNYR